MKKIKQSIYTDLQKAKLFFDDLEEIDKILKESCSSYTITLDEYELDSINEIAEIKEKRDFHHLEIRLDEPRFSLIMDEDTSYIISKEDSLSIGIIERLKPIIRKRRKIYFLSSWSAIFIFSLFVFLFFINSLDIFIDLYSDFIAIILLVLVISLNIIVIRSFYKDDKSKFIVFTTKKSNEQSNYLVENKDELITKLFFGIITTAIGIFIGNKVIPWSTSLLTGQ